jgi:hypothetical protein
MKIAIESGKKAKPDYTDELVTLTTMLQGRILKSENTVSGEVAYSPIFSGLEENIIRNKIFEIIGRL